MNQYMIWCKDKKMKKEKLLIKNEKQIYKFIKNIAFTMFLVGIILGITVSLMFRYLI